MNIPFKSMLSFVLRGNIFTPALPIEQAVHSAPEILHFNVIRSADPSTGINYITNEKGEKSGLRRLSISPLNYHVVMLHRQLSEFQGELCTVMLDLDV